MAASLFLAGALESLDDCEEALLSLPAGGLAFLSVGCDCCGADCCLSAFSGCVCFLSESFFSGTFLEDASCFGRLASFPLSDCFGCFSFSFAVFFSVLVALCLESSAVFFITSFMSVLGVLVSSLVGSAGGIFESFSVLAATGSTFEASLSLVSALLSVGALSGCCCCFCCCLAAGSCVLCSLVWLVGGCVSLAF